MYPHVKDLSILDSPGSSSYPKGFFLNGMQRIIKLKEGFIRISFTIFSMKHIDIDRLNLEIRYAVADGPSNPEAIQKTQTVLQLQGELHSLIDKLPSAELLDVLQFVSRSLPIKIHR